MINIYNCNAFYSSSCGRIEFCAPIKYVHDCYVQGQDAMPYILSILEHNKELSNKLNSLDKDTVYNVLVDLGYDITRNNDLSAYLLFEWASNINDNYDNLAILDDNGKYYNINDNIFQDDPLYYDLAFFQDPNLMIPDNLYIDY